MEQAPVVIRYSLRTGKRLCVEKTGQLLRDVRLHLGLSHCSVVGLFFFFPFFLAYHDEGTVGDVARDDGIA
jgi:hypothetical protein